MSLEKEMLEIVKKNLPEATAGELKAFVEQANRDKKALTEANQELERVSVSVKQKDDKIHQLQSTLEHQNSTARRLEEIKKTEANVAQMQKDIDLTLARNENYLLRERAQEFKNLMEIVFRNPKTVTNQTRFDNTVSEHDFKTNTYSHRKTGENVTTTVSEEK